VIVRTALAMAERGLVPEPVVRWGIRRLLAQRLAEAAKPDPTLDAELGQGPVALVPDAANRQHYELPAAFFQLVLGSHLKYSSAFWNEEIASLVLPLLDRKSDRRFSEPNRWGTNGLEEEALKPELVVEVRYDKLEKHRFRHGTRLIRFRPDKDPDQCTWREVRPARRPDDLAVEDLLR
jgi:hypothetical protein